MQLEQVKIDNEFNRMKSMYDMQRQEITSLFKKDELIVKIRTLNTCRIKLSTT
jgi:uncharacterized membrane-anchored protein YhcB (DUF1043 family)